MHHLRWHNIPQMLPCAGICCFLWYGYPLCDELRAHRQGWCKEGCCTWGDCNLCMGICYAPVTCLSVVHTSPFCVILFTVPILSIHANNSSVSSCQVTVLYPSISVAIATIVTMAGWLVFHDPFVYNCVSIKGHSEICVSADTGTLLPCLLLLGRDRENHGKQPSWSTHIHTSASLHIYYLSSSILCSN